MAVLSDTAKGHITLCHSCLYGGLDGRAKQATWMIGLLSLSCMSRISVTNDPQESCAHLGRDGQHPEEQKFIHSWVCISYSNNPSSQGPGYTNTRETSHFTCLLAAPSTEPGGQGWGWRGCLQHEGAMSNKPSQKNKYESTHLFHSDQAGTWHSARAQRCQAITAPNCHPGQ